MPAISSPNEQNGCLNGINITHPLVGTGCDDAISIDWDITTPIGSATTVTDLGNGNAEFFPDIPGEYEVELCCTSETPSQIDPNLPPIDNSFQLPCPRGGIAGEEMFIRLLNCDGVVNWTVTGPIISANGNTEGITIQLDPAISGIVNISVDCTTTDQNNNETTQTLTCQFPTYLEENLVQDKSETVEIEAVLCGQYCECVKKRFTVKETDADALCEYSELTITIKDCTQPTEEVCE